MLQECEQAHEKIQTRFDSLQQFSPYSDSRSLQYFGKVHEIKGKEAAKMVILDQDQSIIRNTTVSDGPHQVHQRV